MKLLKINKHNNFIMLVVTNRNFNKLMILYKKKEKRNMT